MSMLQMRMHCGSIAGTAAALLALPHASMHMHMQRCHYAGVHSSCQAGNSTS